MNKIYLALRKKIFLLKLLVFSYKLNFLVTFFKVLLTFILKAQFLTKIKNVFFLENPESLEFEKSLNPLKKINILKLSSEFPRTNSRDQQTKVDVKQDVTFLNYPGVYEILDTVNDKSYYGETKLLVHRLDQHHQQLMNESHSCQELVKAFKLQTKNIANFLFIVR